MTPSQQVAILVNQKPMHLETDEVTPEQLREFAKLPADYEVWKVVGNADPEGQLPKDDVLVTGPTKVKSGDRFRVVPPGTFGVAATLPASLADEIEELRHEGFTVEVQDEPDYVVVVFAEWPLPPSYNKPKTALLLRIPRSYPFGKPDMFWTERDLRLVNGQPPRQTSVEPVLGKDWLRFSWHPAKWDPARDNLRMYLAFVDEGLSKARFP